MSGNVSAADQFATVIGKDASFKGELSFTGGVRVDGRFEGSITTEGQVMVSKDGQLKAEVKAGSVALEGQLEGNLTVKDRVEMRATCRMHGDLKAAKLLVVEGATFVGRCEVGPAAKEMGGTGLPRVDDARQQIHAAASGRK